jgi:hypothetical protein
MSQSTPLDAFNQFLLSLEKAEDPAMGRQVEAAWAGMKAPDLATRTRHFGEAVSLGLDPGILLTLALSHPEARRDSIRAVLEVAQPDDKTAASFIFRILGHNRRIGMFVPLSEYGIQGDFRMSVTAHDKSKVSMPLFALLFGHHSRVEEALDFARAMPQPPSPDEAQMALVQLVRSTGMLCEAISRASAWRKDPDSAPQLQERANAYRDAFGYLVGLGADWHQPASPLLLENSDVEEKSGPHVTPASLLWGQLSQMCFRNTPANPFLEMVLDLCNTLPEPARMLVDDTGRVRRIVQNAISFFHGHEVDGYFKEGLTPTVSRYMAPVRTLFSTFSPRQILELVMYGLSPSVEHINRYADFLNTIDRTDATPAELGEVYDWLFEQTRGFGKADSFQNLFLETRTDTRAKTPRTLTVLERVCEDFLKGPVGEMMKRDLSALWTTPHTPLMIQERVGLVKTTFDQEWLSGTLQDAHGTRPVIPRL